MKVHSLKDAAEIVSLRVKNILIVEAKDDYNRNLIFSTLMKELNVLKSDIKFTSYYYWDEFLKLNHAELPKKDLIINFKTFQAIFKYKAVEVEMMSPDSVLRKMDSAMSVERSFVQFVIDNGNFFYSKKTDFIKTFLRHIYNDKNKVLSDAQKADKLYKKEKNPDDQSFKKESLLCIVTNDLKDFEDVEDIAILCRFATLDDELVDRTLVLFKDKAKFSEDKIKDLKTLLHPVNLSQLVHFTTHQVLRKTKEDTIIQEAKKYLQTCLENEEVLEKLPDEYGFEQIGGYDSIKTIIKERVINVWKNRDKAEKYGIHYENGIIMFGPAGVGKTAFVSSLAAELKIPAWKLNLAKILDKFVGETEKRLNTIFELIEKTTSILFIDELDSIGSNREASGLASFGNKVDRNIINLLLQYISNPKRKSLVVGATNLIYEIDPALMRKGRLGTKIYIPFPDLKERIEIFKIHLEKKRKIPHNLDIHELAESTDMYTGAEIESLINDTAIEVLLNKGLEKVSMDHVKKSIAEFQIPPYRKDDIDKHNLLAKFFSSVKIPGITDKEMKDYDRNWIKVLKLKNGPPSPGDMLNN